MSAVPLLDGVRVLDLTNVLAGPFAGYQLALMGADVVKVEVPGTGDLARALGADPDLSARGLGVSFLAQNAAKRSVTVDLKHERGREVFARLVASADVLLENFRPGVLARLGFGWERLRALRPELVYCAVSGFGQTGPMRDLPAYDQIVQGLSGVMSTTGTPDTAPLRTGFPVCDTLGGFAAAFAVAAALVRRERTGEGAHLDVSMLESALVAMGWVVSDYTVAGQVPVPMGNENRTAAPSGTFRTGDGLLNIAANKQEQFAALVRVLAREDLLADPRFATREERKRHRDELRAELERELAGRSADAWVAALAGTGVPVARVLTVPEALDLDQVRHRGLLHEVALPAGEGGPVRVLGSAVHVDGAAVGPAAPPPALGEHTRTELRGLGYTDTEIDELYEEGVL
ncbi:CaiB/BaiF CoA-transferase family protein [Geodermatophilus sp. DSM 44513]|uniref:CaiB/BaiF CoA transferase family protein n=1 Tax=Geodermatophilus sp. DSM 44513 TaxID=1528104 RepID=UPI00126F16AA|nr:CoA transferase [Geodermatophilus sp. DSM 44513]WNV74161.1 CoA transferase [Geodermatophilus sp. DSM 44513]